MAADNAAAWPRDVENPRMNPRSVPDLCPKRRLRGRFLPARLAKEGG